MTSEASPRGHVREIEDEGPPWLGSWANVYRFTLAYLAVTILLFWLFTQYYAPPAGS